jgi:hypothetical protein
LRSSVSKLLFVSPRSNIDKRFLAAPQGTRILTVFTRNQERKGLYLKITMSHRDEYRHWPFLTEEEFTLACAFFDQRYIRATLGPTRKVLKIISRRTATTGGTYIEILRLLQPPKEDDELALALESLGGFGGESATDTEMGVEMADDDDQVCNPFL